ncbi:hypothetical protein [Corynebacterium macginleyi]|uniref:hypothetical protein n=1 Tax=Corynebacterium macginleyi TaxID=38290 RepID=UPI001F378835|nr:hypothetical protein [Corynebacterium macginleyi]
MSKSRPSSRFRRTIFAASCVGRSGGYGLLASDFDQVGALPDVGSTTSGRTYAAVMSADTLFITIPTGVGVGINVKVLENFATHVALALGWQPNREGSVIGYPIG